MENYLTLLKSLKKKHTGLNKIKVAILGDTTLTFLVNAIKGRGINISLDLSFWVADDNSIWRHITTPSSNFYGFQPEIIILYKSSVKLLERYDQLIGDQYQHFADNELNSIIDIYHCLNKNIDSSIIFYNFPEIEDSVFGNYSNKVESSFLFQLRRLNYKLMEFAVKNPNFHICDLSTIQNRHGRQMFFQSSIFINSNLDLSFDILPFIAKSTLDLIVALKGYIKKCIIVDLDNTIWGGNIGDEGVENIEIGDLGIGKVFSNIQYWIKKLKNRGIIIAVCSKNFETTAKTPFTSHPDMILKLDDFSLFIANWNNKAENIQYIQKSLNISMDSIVFLDDNSFERKVVKELIPEITIPDLPDDPACFLEFLYEENLFETVSYSKDDIIRTQYYHNEIKRSSLRDITDESEFLGLLEMKGKVDKLTSFNIPRVVQLSQRSNQFNLRTVRYTESEIIKMVNSKNHLVFVFSLDDKFGSNGIISFIVLEKITDTEIFIESWVMSCRVLNRGMEYFACNTIVNEIKKLGFRRLIGEYIPTQKNKYVEYLYRDLGFSKVSMNWVLEVIDYQSIDNQIKIVNKTDNGRL